MKIIYLLPPSEGKNSWWNNATEKLSFDFKKPFEIAVDATEKDLKCKDKRYEEGIQLNKNIEKWEILPAIERYSWVMYKAIDYTWMSGVWKNYFEDNFLILSGMYGILLPQDRIWNYKLPIETKWLYKYWGNKITAKLDLLHADYIVDLLPGSYAKMIDWENLVTKNIKINFLHNKDGALKKVTHGVKKIKWEYIKELCQRETKSIDDLIGEKVQISENQYHINVISK